MIRRQSVEGKAFDAFRRTVVALIISAGLQNSILDYVICRILLVEPDEVCIGLLVILLLVQCDVAG